MEKGISGSEKQPAFFKDFKLVKKIGTFLNLFLNILSRRRSVLLSL